MSQLCGVKNNQFLQPIQQWLNKCGFSYKKTNIVYEETNLDQFRSESLSVKAFFNTLPVEKNKKSLTNENQNDFFFFVTDSGSSTMLTELNFVGMISAYFRCWSTVLTPVQFKFQSWLKLTS